MFALHGCGGSAKGMAFSLGLNEFASTNKVIMVYPDSECWDNHGEVDGENYMTREGLYPRVFMKMIEIMTTDWDPFDGLKAIEIWRGYMEEREKDYWRGYKRPTDHSVARLFGLSFGAVAVLFYVLM